MGEDNPINDKVDRVEEIIEKLEASYVSLEEAQVLRDEGEAILEELRDTFAVGDGEIIEQ